MLFQLKIIEEIQLLSYLTALIIGIQLIMYLFYHYFNIKKEKHPLNKKIFEIGLIQILIGIFTSLASILNVSNILRDFNHFDLINLIFLIGLVLLTIGYIISLIGLYSFPFLYRFKKTEQNVLKLFIINQKDNQCLYSRDFSKVKSNQKLKDYEKAFSVGIIGIDNILAVITDTKGVKINRIFQQDSLILMEYSSGLSSQIIYALIVKKDLKSNIYLLKFIKNQFEYFYKEILEELDIIEGNKEQLFTSFDVIIKDAIY